MKKLTLETFQHVVEQWFLENQGLTSDEEALLVVQRELGKMIDSHLRSSRFKLNETDRARWERTTQKKVGDVLIFLTRYCALKGWELDECAEGAVQLLTDRSWQELDSQSAYKPKPIVAPKIAIKIKRQPKATNNRKKEPENLQHAGKVLPFRSKVTQESQIPQHAQASVTPINTSENTTIDAKDPLGIALQALGMIMQGDKFVKKDDADNDSDLDEE